MKILKLILLVFVIFLAIDYFGRSTLVKEIAALEKQPEPFKAVKLDSVVQKYIPLNSNKEQVINELEKLGFTVTKDYPLPSGLTLSDVLNTRCKSCDDMALKSRSVATGLYWLPTMVWPLKPVQLIALYLKGI